MATQSELEKQNFDTTFKKNVKSRKYKVTSLILKCFFLQWQNHIQTKTSD